MDALVAVITSQLFNDRAVRPVIAMAVFYKMTQSPRHVLEFPLLVLQDFNMA